MNENTPPGYEGPVEEKFTSFGHMRRIPFGGSDVELMTFEEAGSFHSHDRWEHAVCLTGVGQVEYIDGAGDEGRLSVGEGCLVLFPPEREHRMVPVGDEDYSWLIWYQDEPAPHLEPLAFERLNEERT